MSLLSSPDTCSRKYFWCSEPFETLPYLEFSIIKIYLVVYYHKLVSFCPLVVSHVYGRYVSFRYFLKILKLLSLCFNLPHITGTDILNYFYTNWYFFCMEYTLNNWIMYCLIFVTIKHFLWQLWVMIRDLIFLWNCAWKTKTSQDTGTVLIPFTSCVHGALFIVSKTRWPAASHKVMIQFHIHCRSLKVFMT